MCRVAGIISNKLSPGEMGEKTVLM